MEKEITAYAIRKIRLIGDPVLITTTVKYRVPVNFGFSLSLGEITILGERFASPIGFSNGTAHSADETKLRGRLKVEELTGAII